MGSTRSYACYLAMVLVQIAYGGSNILTKISLDKGLDQFVFVAFRHLIAMFVLGPMAYVLERKNRPTISISTFMKIFVLASLGTTIHLNVNYAGLNYTSATVASALTCVIPSLTFLLSVLLGIEKVMIQSAKGRAKVLGMLICISGALIFTFWKGGYQFKSFVARPLINIHDTKSSVVGLGHHKDDWIKGSLLIITSHVAWSVCLILQAVLCKVYPAQLSLNTLICFIASLQSSVLALIFDRKPASWKLEWNVQLLTIIYSVVLCHLQGVVNSALLYCLQTWCINVKGPVFTAMFYPLLLIIVALFSSIAFAEQLHLGSLIGALFIIIGLYCVSWGKSKDNCTKGKSESGGSSLDHQTLDIFIAKDHVPDRISNEIK